jgi:hypothetical protein
LFSAGVREIELTGLRERFGLFEHEKNMIKRDNIITKGKSVLFIQLHILPFCKHRYNKSLKIKIIRKRTDDSERI